MKKSNYLPMAVAGLCAGAVNGLLGAGGGMVLVPLLAATTNLKEQEIFPASVSVILPICIVSLFLSRPADFLSFADLLPYLAGSLTGGILCGFWGRKIPTGWLHKILGALILWGGVRYLC